MTWADDYHKRRTAEREARRKAQEEARRKVQEAQPSADASTAAKEVDMDLEHDHNGDVIAWRRQHAAHFDADGAFHYNGRIDPPVEFKGQRLTAAEVRERMNGSPPTVDAEEAKRYLRALTRHDERQHEHTTFQTFDDSDEKRGQLVSVMGGQNAAPRLARLNAQGAGIFVTINATDGKGREAHNVTRVRAVYVDADTHGTATLAAIKATGLAPHIVVESSPGKFHCYWLVERDFPMEKFEAVQGALIRKFDTDPKVKDLQRVMRLPGFYHMKDAAHPFMARIVEVKDHKPYALDDIVNGLGLDLEAAPSERKAPAATDGQIVEGNRNNALSQIAFEMRDRGASVEAIKQALLAMNAADNIGLSDDEVEAIAHGKRKIQPNPGKYTTGTAAELMDFDELVEKVVAEEPLDPAVVTKELIERLQAATGIEVKVAASDATRRDKAFRDESRAIGEGSVLEHPPQVYDQQSMLAEAVYISEPAHVTLRKDPRCAWSFENFDKLTAASQRYARGRRSCARAWLRHPARETVYTRTFKPGAPLFCKSPKDESAINTWREPVRIEPPPDWQARAQAFLDHVVYLVPVPEEREFFFDWLAHIEQKPGELPHVHVLMFTPRHGIGRNWLSSVLARVWPGVTALDVDLPQLLEGRFNGVLSRKIFAVVNEIHEGLGLSAYRIANRLRTLLTDETRLINPKYGHQQLEYNATRWLMFSNHESALPLDRFDRRIYAIRNPDTPRDADYYTKLYAMAADPLFIASVREYLRRRDISKFNPGMHAPMTETKRQVVEASMSAADEAMQDALESYPSDCVTGDVLMGMLYGDRSESTARDRAGMRFVAERWGARKYRQKVRMHGSPKNVWVLRDHEKWLKASPGDVEKEVKRGERASIAQDLGSDELV